MIRIKESNMVFEFDNEYVFIIENSLLHTGHFFIIVRYFSWLLLLLSK